MQSIIDEEDKDELFNMIADQIHGPTWMTPIFSNGVGPELHASSPSTSAPATSQAWPSKSAHTAHAALISCVPAATFHVIIYAHCLCTIHPSVQ